MGMTWGGRHRGDGPVVRGGMEESRPAGKRRAGVIRSAAAETKTAAYAKSLQDTPRRSDDRRDTANRETPGRSRANFSGGFYAQREAQLAPGVDQAVPAWGHGRTGSSTLGQGKARAQEAAWGGHKTDQGR